MTAISGGICCPRSSESNFIAAENTSFGPPNGGWFSKENGTPKISGKSRLVKYYSICPDSCLILFIGKTGTMALNNLLVYNSNMVEAFI